jgi:aldehyde dehydrogenase (NAD+)
MATATAPQARKVQPPKVKDQPMLIGGKWVDSQSGKTFPTVNPATGETICQVAEGDKADIDQAVKAARKAFESGPWPKMSAAERGRFLYKLADAIEKNIDDLAALESLDNGKPLRDARAADLPLSVKCYRYYAGWADKIHGKTIPIEGNYFCYTRHEPVGVIGQLIPWNFPLLMQAWKWGPALAAGNTIVLKPAEQTPLTALRVAQLAQEVGFPDGVVNVVPGFGETAGAALTSHMDVDKVAFTGEGATGKLVMTAAAQSNLKRVSLELGGKSPNIVFADADLEQAAGSSPMSVFANTGQDCCARSRVFVERPVFEAFVERFVATTKKLRLGDPAKETTQIGPLVSASQRRSSEEFIEETRRAGRVVACGGGRPHSRGFYLEPAVLLGVEPGDRVWQEEVFGPVVCIRPFDDEARMLREVNDSRYGLSGSIWTNDLRRALRVARQVESGVLSINSHSSVHVEAPFGGFKQSGLGRDLGMSAMEGYTELKNIYVAE